jgi:CRISPR-associated protein Csm5
MRSIAMKTIISCYIKTIAPVHIGCGEIYEPTSFIINENTQELIAFDRLTFAATLTNPEKQTLKQICLKGNIGSIVALNNFIRNKHVEGQSVALCKGFLTHYQQKIRDLNPNNEKEIIKEFNRFEISRTAWCQKDHRPYIPGSAMKGAIRTAYLNAMQFKQKLKKEKNAQQLEKKLLHYQKLESDPFRLIKVSDFMPVGKVSTNIVYAVNEKKMPTKHAAGGPYQILEVITPGAIFKGNICVELPQSKNDQYITSDALLNAIETFYYREKLREDGELIRLGFKKPDKPLKEKLLRMGRHSGAESITIEGHRNIKIMRGRGERPDYKEHATTLWLASEERMPTNKTTLKPFGWVSFHELTSQQSAQLDEQEDNYQIQAIATKHAKKAQKEKAREEQLAKEQRAAEKAREAEEQKRIQEEYEETLAAMSPEEKDLEKLKNSNVIENEVVEIYKKLDDYPENFQTHIASGLKEYWIKQNKWKKKACSKKQWEKVQEVKQVLQEI